MWRGTILLLLIYSLGPGGHSSLSVEYGLESKFRVSGSSYDGQCQWAMLGVSGIREGGGY